jgi:hypothetical protein
LHTEAESDHHHHQQQQQVHDGVLADTYAMHCVWPRKRHAAKSATSSTWMNVERRRPLRFSLTHGTHWPTPAGTTCDPQVLLLHLTMTWWWQMPHMQRWRATLRRWWWMPHTQWRRATFSRCSHAVTEPAGHRCQRLCVLVGWHCKNSSVLQSPCQACAQSHGCTAVQMTKVVDVVAEVAMALLVMMVVLET